MLGGVARGAVCALVAEGRRGSGPLPGAFAGLFRIPTRSGAAEKGLRVASVPVWLSFVVLCLHSWNLFAFEMEHVFSHWPASLFLVVGKAGELFGSKGRLASAVP